MKITKNSRVIEGTLSNGNFFSLEIIKRDENWLFGVHTGSISFFTTSEDFKGLIGVQIPMKLLVDLRVLGITDEDAKTFVKVLSKLVNEE